MSPTNQLRTKSKWIALGLALVIVIWWQFFTLSSVFAGVRLRIISNMSDTDQVLLAKAAIEDVSSRVREAAVEQLTDQTALAKVAVEESDYSVRTAALKKLTDQALLAKIAVEAHKTYDRKVREVAVEALTDQAFLAKLVIKQNDYSIGPPLMN